VTNAAKLKRLEEAKKERRRGESLEVLRLRSELAWEGERRKRYCEELTKEIQEFSRQRSEEVYKLSAAILTYLDGPRMARDRDDLRTALPTRCGSLEAVEGWARMMKPPLSLALTNGHRR
jgi:hypothetical protein